jgi:hypothetical protein
MPSRRRGFNQRFVYETAAGQRVKVFVTANIDPRDGRIKEVFASNPMIGSDIEALLTDGSILLSLCLQAGVSIAEVVDKLGDLRRNAEDEPGKPTSILGAIARSVKAIDDDLLAQREAT